MRHGAGARMPPRSVWWWCEAAGRRVAHRPPTGRMGRARMVAGGLPEMSGTRGEAPTSTASGAGQEAPPALGLGRGISPGRGALSGRHGCRAAPYRGRVPPPHPSEWEAIHPREGRATKKTSRTGVR